MAASFISVLFLSNEKLNVLTNLVSVDIFTTINKAQYAG